MANESYVASADDYGSKYEESSEYAKNMQRSTRVLSKFNQEQKKSIIQTIRQTTIIVAASSAINTLMNRTVRTITRGLKAFTLQPMIDGLSEYTSQVEKFRSIMQNTTQFYEFGDTASQIDDITDALDKLNDYADLTIYKFSDMVSAISGFTVAGLNIDDATAVAEGIGNLVAAMGGDSQTYASVSGMFNQAIQRGNMIYYQWRSISQFAKVGGMQTKQLLVNAAKVLGTEYPEFDDSLYEADGITLKSEPSDETFEASLTDDWLTTAVMVEAMKVMAGSYNIIDEATGEIDEAATRLRLAEMGYTDTVISLALNGKKMAQEVRSFSQMMDAVSESFGTGWAKVFRSIFGNTEEATSLWTGLMNAITDDIGTLTGKIGEQADQFVEAGGRAHIQGILENLWGIMRRIGKAIGKLIPDDLGTRLSNVAGTIEQITAVLAGTAKGSLTPVQTATQAILDVFGAIVQIIYKVISIFKKLWQVTEPIRTGIWTMVSNILPQLETLIMNILGYIESVVDLLDQSGVFDALGSIFTGASSAVDAGLASGVGSFLKGLIQSVANAFGGLDLSGIFGALADVGESLAGMFSGEGTADSAFSFVSNMIKIIFALKLLKPAFKQVAAIAKSFNGVEGSFLTIIGSVIAIIIALEAFNQINADTLAGLFWKAIVISFELKLLAKGISAIAMSAKEAYKLIPMFLIVGLLIAGVIASIIALQNNGVNIDGVIAFLNSISKFLKSIAWIIGMFAALLMVISIRSVLVNKNGKKAAEQSKNALDTIAEIFKGGVKFDGKLKLNTSFQLGDAVAKRILALSAMIASIGYAVEVIGDEIKFLGRSKPEEIKQGAKVVGIIAGALVIMIAALVIIAKVAKIGTTSNLTTMWKGSGLGSLLKGGGRLKESSYDTDGTSYKNPLWSIAITILAIGAAIWMIGRSIEQLGSLDPGVLKQGAIVVGSITGALAILIAGIGVLSHFKMTPNILSVVAIGALLGEVIIALLAITGVIVLAGLIPIKILAKGGIAVFAMLSTMALLMEVLCDVADSMGHKANWSNIAMVLLGFLEIAGIVAVMAAVVAGLGVLAAFNSGALWQGYAAMVAIVSVLVGVMFLLTKFSTKMDVKANWSNIAFALLGLVEIAAAALIAAGAVAIMSIFPMDRVVQSGSVLVALIGIMVGIMWLLGKMNSGGKNASKIGLSLLSIVTIAAVVAMVAEGIANLADMDTGKMWAAFGVISLTLTVAAAIFAAIAALALTGIGTIGIGVAAAALLAIAAAIWLIAEAFYKFSLSGLNAATATEKLAIAISMFKSSLDDVMDLDIDAFSDKLEQYISVLQQNLPALSKAIGQFGNVSGSLILAGGDVTIGAGTVAMSAAGAMTVSEEGAYSSAAEEEKDGDSSVTSAAAMTVIGAGIGTAIAPGIGTAIGAAAGYLLVEGGKIVGSIVDGWTDGVNQIGDTNYANDIQDTERKYAYSYWQQTGDDSKWIEYQQKYGGTNTGILSGILGNTNEICNILDDSDLGGIIDVNEYLSTSAYSDMLDNVALGSYTKSEVEEALENAEEVVRTSGTVTDANVEAAIKQALANTSINGTINFDGGTMDALVQAVTDQISLKFE